MHFTELSAERQAIASACETGKPTCVMFQNEVFAYIVLPWQENETRNLIAASAGRLRLIAVSYPLDSENATYEIER